MARTYNDIYYNDDENSTAEILDDMKKLAESVDQQIGSIKSFNNDTSQFIEQVTPLMSNLSEQVIDMHQLADTMFTELEQVKEENKQLREDLNGLPKGQASGETIDLSDSAEMRCELKISGNSEQETREGYNLLNLTSLIGKTETKNGITYKINEDCSITVNGTPTDYTSFILRNMSLKAGTYKFVDGLNSNQVFLQTIGDFQYTSPNHTFSLAEDGQATVYLVILAGTPTLNNTTLYPMIYEGTEDKPYEQYGAMPSPDYPSEVESCGDNGSINEVICNKNFLKLNDVKETNKNGLTYSCENGIIKINGTATTEIMIDFESFEMPAGIYKMSRNASGTYNANWQNYLRNSDGSFIDGAMGEARFTFNEKKNVLFRIFINSNSTFENYIMKPQVELGSISTDYIEHQSQTYTIPTQQPMRSIGDTRDTFIKKNNKWYERHYINRLILNGTESWTFNESSINPFGVVLRGVTKLTDSQSNAPNCISNYFTTVAWSETVSGGKFYESEFLMTSLTDNNLRIRNNNYSTLDDFKSWLAEQYNAGTPVYVDYLLATPTDIECTLEQTEILNQMYIKAKTYKGVTHMYSTDNVSPVIDVTYKKDIETLFANTLVEGV